MDALTTTRAELRRRIGRLLGDVVQLEATSAGTTTTFIDAIRLSSALESPVNRDIVFLNGTNLGQVRRVTSWTVGTGTLNFTALPAATASGDFAEIYNRHAKGWTVAEYNDAINSAIDATWPVYKEAYTAEVSAFDSSDPVLAVPAEFSTVSLIQYLNADSLWTSIPSTSWVHHAALGEIVVSGDTLLAAMDGYTVRLLGATRPEPLDEDTDTTSIRPDFLVYQAAALLCQNRFSRGETEFYNPMLLNQQFADKFKPRSRNEGVSVRVL